PWPRPLSLHDALPIYNRDALAKGLKLTLEVSAIGIAGSTAIGIVLGAARAHRIPVVSQLASVYVEVIRNTPILAQIFLLYFGLPDRKSTRLNSSHEWI